jgi:hypothetical protein
MTDTDPGLMSRKDSMNSASPKDRRASNLLGQDSCLELFIAWHEQQVKVGLLGIAEEKILADFRAQKLVYLAAGFNGWKGVVVHTDKGDLKGIQQIIGADFFILTAGCVGGTALI